VHLLRVGCGGLLLAPGEDAQERLAVGPRRRWPDVVLPHHARPGRGGGGEEYSEQEQQEERRRGHGGGKGRARAGSGSSGPHRAMLFCLWGAARYDCTAGYFRRGHFWESESTAGANAVTVAGLRRVNALIFRERLFASSCGNGTDHL